MTPDVYRRAGILFDQLRLLPEEQRSAILDAACSEDSQLRRQVLLLLEFDQEATGGAFLEKRALEDAARLVAAGEPELPVAETVVGNYRLGQRIGSGGMGVVYEAEDSRLQRRVAVKVLPLPFAGEGPERVKRFQQEARAVSLLNHPNIVSIFDAGCDQRFWYIATEFIEGETLRRRMIAGPIGFEELLDVTIQCATALAAAHRAGVLHRDIKPENIMIRPDGVVKIVDFGLARVISPSTVPGPTQTQAGLVVGTPRYMSPEQARGEKTDARSDIFSLAAVMYEMAAGRPAFAGETTADVLAALLTVESAAPSTWNRESPPRLDPIVAKALAKDRSARHRSMDEFAADLRALKQRVDFERQTTAWQESRKPRRRVLLVAAAMALLLTAWASWRWWRPSSTAQNEAAGNVVPLTSFAGFKDYPALSPDGTKVAFSWNGGQGGKGGKQERNIYVMPVGEQTPRQLTESAEDNRWPAWSPDGRHIAFGRGTSYWDNAFFIVPSAGGPERKIADGGLGVSWSPDGRQLAIGRSHASVGPSGIFLVSVESGERRELTDPRQAFDSFPAFSPDGRWVAFNRGPVDVRSEIWIAPAAGGQARQLTVGPQKILGLTWTADSNEIIASVEREGYGTRLWRVSIEGGGLKRVAVPADNASYPQAAAHGGRLAYTQFFYDTNIYVLSGNGFGAGPAPAPFGPGRALLLSSREDDSPAFSSDGRWVVFVSSRSGDSELWLARRDGGNPRQLTSFRGAAVGTPRWSPDSQWIAFGRRSSANTDIWIIGADGGSLRQVTHDASSEMMASWSPDGKWIYFTSDRSGAEQIYKIAAGGGAELPVTKGGGREAWPSPDGKWIYFTRRSLESAIWMVPVGGGPEQPVPELEQYQRVSRAWGVLPQGIYFISREDKPRQEVRFFSFATRQITSLGALEKEPIWTVPTLALSPDGKSLLSVHLDHEVNDLMLIENFR